MAGYQTAKSEAARSMCARLIGECRCREMAQFGTCANEFDAFVFALATFLAHPGARTTDDERANMAAISLRESVFPDGYSKPSG
jgi:hypothetical protein